MKVTPAPIKSQLVNAGANQKAAPSSQLAQFVVGDIKGGEAAHNYRMQVIAASIREALKGNSRALIEAATFTSGKSKKARAYAAGFAAVGVPARVQYAGKLDAPENEAARRAIMEQSASLEFEFEAAYLTVSTAPTEPKAPKAKAATSDASDTSDTSDTPAPVALDVEVMDVCGAAARAIAGGIATAAEIETIRAALAQYDAERATLVALENMAAEPVAA